MITTLRDYQKVASDIGVGYFFHSEKNAPSIMVLPTAWGKSVLIADIAKRLGGGVLVLQPSKELLEQNYRKFISMGGEASIYSASAGRKEFGSVTYATIGSIKTLGSEFKRLGYKYVIVDECFPAGTLIDGKKIESLRIGDFVNSFNHSAGLCERKKVVRIFRKKHTGDLVRIRLSNGVEFTCTENHPIFTVEGGYVTAKQLYLSPSIYTLLSNEKKNSTNQDGTGDLQQLQNPVNSDRRQKKGLHQDGKGLLLKRLFSCFSIWGNSVKTQFRSNEKEKSNVDAWDKRENDSVESGEKVCDSRGKWKLNCSSEKTAQCHRTKNGAFNINKGGQTSFRQNTKFIQGGLGLFEKKVGGRSGWGFSRWNKAKNTGQEEGFGSFSVGLESVEIIKHGSAEWVGSLCENHYVYNIEVEDNHNYFAFGTLVHNCHLFPPKDSMFSGFITAMGCTKVLGVTATPFRLQTSNDISGWPVSKLVMLTSRAKNAGFFKDILHVHQIQDIVRDGYWSKLEYETWEFDDSGLKFNSSGSDFRDDSIAQAYEMLGIQDKIIRRIRESDRKSILVFVPEVKDALAMARSIDGSVAVYGDMPKAERDEAIEGFRSGRYRVAINVNVLSVGFDHPELDCVIFGRPTASLAWFYQAAGRGTRIHSEKQDCLIIDFVGNISRFGRLENLTVEKYKASWQVFSGDILLTSIPIKEIGTVKKEQPGESFIWPFGKYKGTPIGKIESGYLKWVLANFEWKESNRDLKHRIDKELGARSLTAHKIETQPAAQQV